MAIAVLNRPGFRWILRRLLLKNIAQSACSGADLIYHDGWLIHFDSWLYPVVVDDLKSASSVQRKIEYFCRCKRATSDYWYRGYTPGPGDTVVDVGAGEGEDLRVFSSTVGPMGLVVAIEGHPETFARLSRYTAINGLSNVVLVQTAVSDYTGIGFMECSSKSWEENRLAGNENGSIRVDVERLDGILDRLAVKKVNLLKMNIEGGEVAAIEGLGDWIRRTENCVIACHDFIADLGGGEEFRTRSKIEEYMLFNGFSVSGRKRARKVYLRDHVFAKTRTTQDAE